MPCPCLASFAEKLTKRRLLAFKAQSFLRIGVAIFIAGTKLAAWERHSKVVQHAEGVACINNYRLWDDVDATSDWLRAQQNRPERQLSSEECDYLCGHLGQRQPASRINPMNDQDQRQLVVGSMSADDRKGMPSAVRIDFGPPMFAHARPRLKRPAREREGLLRSGQLDWLSVTGFAPRDGCDWLGDQAFA
ncbi:hypothetical protein MKX08_010567 [Trichoderma sp. CBMAI-0020]|nr:hypothetical protein MKX08_010567 [Trichoderma sp. CBMAI-0020]